MYQFFQIISDGIRYYKNWNELLSKQRILIIRKFDFTIDFMLWMLIAFLIFYAISNLLEDKTYKKLKKDLISSFNKKYEFSIGNEKNEFLNGYIEHYSIERKYYNKKISNQIFSYIVMIFVTIFILVCELREMMLLDELYIFSKSIFIKNSLLVFITLCLIGDLWYIFKLYSIYHADNYKKISSLQENVNEIEKSIYQFETKKKSIISISSENEFGEKTPFYKEKVIFYPNGNESEFYRNNNGTLQIKIKCSK